MSLSAHSNTFQALLCLAFASSTLLTAQQPGEPAPSSAKLEVNVNKVVVPVVVRDKQGRAIGGLKKEDFTVFDDDKPRPVASLVVETHEATSKSSQSPTQAAPEGTNSPVASPGVPPPVLPSRFIVFLFDDMHLSVEDLANTQKAAAKVLAEALSASDTAAIVSLSGKANSGFTTDPAKLREAILGLRVHSLYQVDGNECPSISYYEADLILNKSDQVASESALRKVANCSPGLNLTSSSAGQSNDILVAQNLVNSAARRALTVGMQDVLATYAQIEAMVGKMSSLPGQRMLILVSPGFLPIEEESRTAESRMMDLAVQSNVSVSALDARGLYTSEINANERGSGFSNFSVSAPGVSPGTPAGASLQLDADYHRTAMNLAEDAMSEMAEGTGGKFFHNSNDLGAGFKSLTEAPEYVYLLDLSVNDVKPDGRYHRLKVKVDREGLQLEARRGYVMRKPGSPSNMSADSDEVLLNIVALDRKDKPVLDLKAGDVAVTEGDSQVALNSFRLVTGKDQGERLLTLVFDQPGAGVDSHRPLDPSATDAQRDIAIKLLKNFPEKGFSFSVLDVQGHLRLQHGFTSDRKALAQAINAATQPGEPAAGGANPQERELVAVARTGADPSGTAVGSRDFAWARALYSALNNSGRIVQDQHLQPSFAALLALAQSQQPFAERKALIYFTSLGGRQADSRTREAVNSIIGAANRAGVAIYIIDLNRLDRRSAKLEAMGMAISAPSSGALSGEHTTRDPAVNQETSSSILEHLAEGTGGSYIVAEDDISKPAKQLVQDTTTYYRAAYLPSIGEYDGEFRPVAVKPLRAGLSLRAQSGYVALPVRGDTSAGASLQPFEMPLLKILSQAQLPADVRFHAAILHMEDLPEGSANALAVEAPLSALEVRQDASTNLYSAHVSIVAEIKDSSGAAVAHFSEDIPQRGLLRDLDAAQSSAITLQRHFIAPPGQYVLEVAIQDANSGKYGAQHIPFELAKTSGAPSLSDVVLVRKTAPFRIEDDPSEPLQHGNDRVTPNLSGQLPLGARDFSMFFIVHPDPAAPEPATITVQIFKDGKPKEGAPTISQQARKALFSSYLANLSVDPPEDGSYEVRATLTQGGKTAESRTTFALAGAAPPKMEVASAQTAAPVSEMPAPAVDAANPISAPPVESDSKWAITFPTNPIQPPLIEELNSMLQDARDHAINYTQSLPNFVCEQVTNRSIDLGNTGQWKHKDEFTELLTYVDQTETRTLLKQAVKGSGTGTDNSSSAGAVSAGEFGGVIEGVFKPESKTDFKWKESALLGEESVQVFDYRVARANSILDIGAGTTTYVACHGQVFIDGATRAVRRITMIADDVPKESRVQAVTVSVDYDYVSINNHDYMLPSSAQIIVRHDRRETDLNEIRFRNFHRFSSTVKILSAGEEPKP